MENKLRFLTLAIALAFTAGVQAQYVDVTDTYIKNARFTDAVNGWTNVGMGGWLDVVQGPVVLQHYVGETPTSSFSFTQKIGLPAGCYRLENNAIFRNGAAATYTNDSHAYLKAGSHEVTIKHLFADSWLNDQEPWSSALASLNFQAGKFPNSVEFKLTQNTEVEVGVYGSFVIGNSWFVTGPFRLFRNDLKYKIEECESVLDHSTGDKTAFSSAITAAKAVEQTDVEAATAAVATLEAARQTYVLSAAPEDGYPFDFSFKVVNNQFNNGNDGWQGGMIASGLPVNPCMEAWNGNWAIWQTPTGLPSGQYVIRVQGYYRYGADAFAVGADNRMCLYADNSKKKPLVSIVTGAMDQQQYKNTESGNEWKSDANRDGKWVPFSPLGASVFFLKGRYENELPYYVSGSQLEIAIKNENHIEFDWSCIDNVRLEYLGAHVPANMKVSAVADWGTFVAPFAVTIPEGIRAFTVSYSGGKLTYNELTTTIPAGTPVVLKNSGTADFDQTFYGNPNTANVTEFTNSSLVGTTDVIAVPMEKGGNAVYLLQYKDGEAGWHKVQKLNLSLIANRAYLIVPNSQDAKDFIPMGDFTGITSNAIVADSGSDDAVYTLSGQKATPGYKGIVIKNNKKYIRR